MNDPYTDTQNCIDRLYREYLKHPRLIVACDFDDTLFPYHGTNATHERVLDLLRQCQSLNFYIVLYTASKAERFMEMLEYLRERGINVDSINTNPISLPYGNHGKIYYNLFLDDRCGLGQACETLEGLISRINSAKNT